MTVCDGVEVATVTVCCVGSAAAAGCVCAAGVPKRSISAAITHVTKEFIALIIAPPLRMQRILVGITQRTGKSDLLFVKLGFVDYLLHHNKHLPKFFTNLEIIRYLFFDQIPKFL